MPNWLGQLLQALGLATPFIYAAATYGFCHWLDKKASIGAKRTISSWFYWRPPSEAISKAIVEIFDRVYSTPLFAWRAFARSTFLTLLVTCMWVLIVAQRRFGIEIVSVRLFGFQLLSNIFVDYISLFAIRYLLAAHSTHPVLMSLIAPTIGMLVVAALSILRIYFWFGEAPMARFENGATIIFLQLDGMAAPAIAVHLWIPLLILVVFLVKAAGIIFRATTGMQWFLKRGGQHPLEALGLVAGTLVFFGAIIGHWV